MTKLEKITKIGIPVAAGLAALAVVELTGLSKHLQSYEFAKAEVVREYFGAIGYYASYGVACATRVLVDGTALVMGCMIGNAINEARGN